MKNKKYRSVKITALLGLIAFFFVFFIYSIGGVSVSLNKRLFAQREFVPAFEELFDELGQVITRIKELDEIRLEAEAVKDSTRIKDLNERIKELKRLRQRLFDALKQSKSSRAANIIRELSQLPQCDLLNRYPEHLAFRNQILAEREAVAATIKNGAEEIVRLREQIKIMSPIPGSPTKEGLEILRRLTVIDARQHDLKMKRELLEILLREANSVVNYLKPIMGSLVSRQNLRDLEQAAQKIDALNSMTNRLREIETALAQKTLTVREIAALQRESQALKTEISLTKRFLSAFTKSKTFRVICGVGGFSLKVIGPVATGCSAVEIADELRPDIPTMRDLEVTYNIIMNDWFGKDLSEKPPAPIFSPTFYDEYEYKEQRGPNEWCYRHRWSGALACFPIPPFDFEGLTPIQ